MENARLHGDPAGVIRVHRLIARLNVGGPAFHVSHLSAGLEEPFRTTLVAGEPGPDEGDLTALPVDLGVDVRIVKGLGRELSPLRDALVLVRLFRLFRREKPRIVHTHTAKAGSLGRLAAAMAGVPVRIHTFHGHVLGGGYFSARKTELFRRIEGALARLTTRIVVLSEGQREELSQLLRVAHPEAFRVIPLGLELASFRELEYPSGKARRRALLGLPPDRFVIASVGRLVPIKGHELLFRAVARLARGGTVDPVILVVGGGEREAELRALAEELGIGDLTIWMGWSDDLPAVLGASDVLALTSKDEGTPVAVIEAVVAGLPVVATAVGGVPELLEGVDPAWLVEPGSAEDLERALEQAAQSGGAIPEAVRDRFMESFSVTRLVRDMEGLYRDELARAGIRA